MNESIMPRKGYVLVAPWKAAPSSEGLYVPDAIKEDTRGTVVYDAPFAEEKLAGRVVVFKYGTLISVDQRHEVKLVALEDVIATVG